jgi:RND family efflux transporter MFP subunit
MGPIELRGSSRSRGFALGVVSVLAAGCSQRDATERTPPPPTVAVAEARQMTVPILAEPIGTTRALQEVSVRARVRGFLKEIKFQEGTDVKAGQLLFVIDEEPFLASKTEAEAKLALSEANLKRAKESKAREIATAQLAVDQAVLGLGRVEEARQIALNKRAAASPEDVDRAVANRKRSEAQVEADKASRDQAISDFDTNILSAQADVAASKAQLHQAEIDLGYCRMFSPIDGRIGLAEVKLGNLVGPATNTKDADYTELAVVRQLDPMGVDIQAASRYLNRVAQDMRRRDMTLEVFQPGLEGDEARRYPGKATVIDNTINPATSTFLVRAEVANPENTLLPGEYVKVNAKVGEVPNAVVVPEQAVVETQAGPVVYTVDAQGKVAIAPVKAGLVHEGLRVVESGLKSGQTVIVEGLQLVRSGMAVKTRKAAAEKAEAGRVAGREHTNTY